VSSRKVRFLQDNIKSAILKSLLITLKGAACCSCLSPVRTFYVVKSDTERFGNVYSGPAVRTGRTVGPTWVVVGLEVLDRESISFGVWVHYRFVTQWRLNVCELNHGWLFATVATCCIVPRREVGRSHEWSSRSTAFRTNGNTIVNSVGNWKEYEEGTNNNGGVDIDRLIRDLGAGHGLSLLQSISVYDRIEIRRRFSKWT
jgi:hypothetical protein